MSKEEKNRLASLCTNSEKIEFLNEYHCNLSKERIIWNIILRASSAVNPFNISQLRRVALGLLAEEPAVLRALSSTSPNENTRQLLLENLVDASFAECLTGCYLDIDW